VIPGNQPLLLYKWRAATVFVIRCIYTPIVTSVQPNVPSSQAGAGCHSAHNTASCYLLPKYTAKTAAYARDLRIWGNIVPESPWACSYAIPHTFRSGWVVMVFNVSLTGPRRPQAALIHPSWRFYPFWCRKKGTIGSSVWGTWFYMLMHVLRIAAAKLTPIYLLSYLFLVSFCWPHFGIYGQWTAIDGYFINQIVVGRLF
jgi:hypothetical protein